MAIIEQKQLFEWKEIEFLGDLERLYLALNNLPDENLMQVLENRVQKTNSSRKSK